MRHLLVAAALLLAAVIVTLGAATVLENMATQRARSEQPFTPGSDAPAVEPPLLNKPPAPQQSRSLSLLSRRS
jgi:hypothetical protein